MPFDGKHPKRFRLAMLFFGVAVFVWVTLDLNDLRMVATLGVAGGILAGWRVTGSGRGGLRWLFFGGAAGVSAALISVGLMFLKNAVHAHPLPDFPLPILLGMLERAPAWGAAGALIGAAAALMAQGE